MTGSNLIRKPGGGLGLAGLGGGGNDSEHGGIPADVINSCDTHELSSVFIHSDRLNGEVGKHFVANCWGGEWWCLANSVQVMLTDPCAACQWELPV
jgi:hypothetical protein